MRYLVAANEWKKVTDKFKWQELASDDRARYRREMEEYNRVSNVMYRLVY